MSRIKNISLSRVQKHALSRLVGPESAKAAIAFKIGVHEHVKTSRMFQGHIVEEEYTWNPSEQTWLFMFTVLTMKEEHSNV